MPRPLTCRSILAVVLAGRSAGSDCCARGNEDRAQSESQSRSSRAAGADGRRLCLCHRFPPAEVRLLAGQVRQADAGRAADSRRRLAGRRQDELRHSGHPAVPGRRHFRGGAQLPLHRAGDGGEGRAAGEGPAGRRGPRTANDPLQGQGVEHRSERASARRAARPARARRSGWHCTTTWPIPRATIRLPANRRG